MFRILLIEDDQSLFQEIKAGLAKWEFEVSGPDNFQNVMSTFAKVKPDLVIIDIQLPKYDGFHWCRLIREHSSVPIIFLSSRDHPTDMVMSMNLGADDYIQKPFHFEVLTAKIQALLRRVYNYGQEANVLKTWAGAAIDTERSQVTKNEKTTELTKNEMFILRMLVEKKNQIVTRDTLIEELWEDERFISDNTLTVNVNRLRKKLEVLGLGGAIETKVGQGYIAREELLE